MQAWLPAGVAVAAALACAVLTWMAIGYAHRRRMLDEPGRRRSHAVPTARGGGIAIIAVLLAGVLLLVAGGRIGTGVGLAFCVGLALVAGIGWVDDHRPLSAGSRLLVHFIAATLVVAFLPEAEAARDPPTSWLLRVLQVVGLAAAINFWNFMDGINGLVASQSAWAAGCAAVLLALAGCDGWALAAVMLAAATLAFLPFNFPRARIFLGDVGSGGLGFACGALLLLAHGVGAVSIWSVMAIVSVLMFDAGLTLLSRMARGRRWYTPHREHLYQWLVRSGSSHTGVTALFFSWNLMIVLPLVLVSQRDPSRSPLYAAAAALAATLAWWLGRRHVLARAARGGVR